MSLRIALAIFVAIALCAQPARSSVNPPTTPQANGGQVQLPPQPPTPVDVDHELDVAKRRHAAILKLFEDFSTAKEMQRLIQEEIKIRDIALKDLKKDATMGARMMLNNLEETTVACKEYRKTLRETQKTMVLSSLKISFKLLMAGLPVDSLGEPAVKLIELVFEAMMFTGENAGTIIKAINMQDPKAAMETIKSFGVSGLMSATDQAISHTWEQVVVAIGKAVATKMSEEGLKQGAKAIPVLGDCLTIFDLVKAAYKLNKQSKKTINVLKVFQQDNNKIFLYTPKMIQDLQEHQGKLQEMVAAFKEQLVQIKGQIKDIKNIQ